ncbi:MAG: bifunctional DNA-formamidopyrimidine glycosylase/DNA-(apurinic or apyrimidinic site) lyase [Proteobacteria bacterium]|nr:bifunctional DNA-formamidopyrimidine glycosylase/DNA-(apurinic or apyrimidinic site) lyase [Pseudomonadota bacterium]
MPELPEVETVRRTLEPAIGARISSAWCSGLGLHMGRKPPLRKLRALVGATITGLRRHGKYLLLDTDRPQSILAHLGMTGRLRIVPASEPRVPHTHVVIGLGARDLRYIDARRFGQFDVVERATESAHPALAELGPDPITDGLDPEALHALARTKRTTVKAFILDQGVIAGVGNIYASEALWRAQLRPTLRTHKLTAKTTKALIAAIQEVLRRAIENNGTSLRDFVDADGSAGSNWEYLWVYDRLDKPCPRCKTSIRRAVHQGRATYYCPTCQAA